MSPNVSLAVFAKGTPSGQDRRIPTSGDRFAAKGSSLGHSSLITSQTVILGVQMYRFLSFCQIPDSTF